MGCGCGRGRARNTSFRRRTAAVRPKTVSAQSKKEAVAPDQLKALGTTQTQPQGKQLDAERRRIEKLRRDAIRRRLNK